MKAKNFKVHSPLPESLSEECDKAADILNHFVKGKTALDSAAIPPKIIQNAKGIAVVTILKAGFLWSGRAGCGLVVARLPDGRWSAPSAIATGGVGFGAQIGAQLTDCVFILNTWYNCYSRLTLRDAVKAFSHGGNVTLGGNLSVAAGPVGRSGEASGSLVNLAPVYSYSKTKGLFAGISLEGSVLITRNDANAKFYQRKVSPKELLGGQIEPPAAAEPLYRALNLKFGSALAVSSASALPRPSSSVYNNGNSTDTKQSYTAISGNSTFSNNYRKNSELTSSNGPPRPPPPYATVPRGIARSAESNEKRASATGYSNEELASIVPKRPPPLPPKKKYAVAQFAFNAERPGDLSFQAGDRIEVVKATDNTNDWWVGRLNGTEGQFPANYVQLM